MGSGGRGRAGRAGRSRIGGGHHHGIGHRHHHHGGGGGGPTFNKEVDEGWEARWRYGLCATDHTAICLESFFCCYCMLGRVGNVLTNPVEWKEEDGSCQQFCWLACILDFCSYGMGCLMNAQVRCGLLAKYQIGGESNCSSCCIAMWCPCCSVNQMVHELTAHGEYPGGVCSNRPSNIPERPPPPQPTQMDQMIQLSMQMAHGMQNAPPGQPPMAVAGGMNYPQHQQQQWNTVGAGDGMNMNMNMGMNNNTSMMQQQQQYDPNNNNNNQQYYGGYYGNNYGNNDNVPPPPPPPMGYSNDNSGYNNNLPPPPPPHGAGMPPGFVGFPPNQN